MAIAQPDAKKSTIYGLLQEAMQRHDDDCAAAQDDVFSRLSRDTELLRGIIRDEMAALVAMRARSVLGNRRAAVISASQKAANDKQGAMALVRGIAASLLDIPLANGRALRDATRDEIVEAAERYEKQSETMAHRARWLRLIAQSVPPGKTCGAIITDTRALELFEEAK